MSYVVADSRPESLSLIAAQHEDWIIRQAITLLEQRIFKAGPMLNSPAAVRDYLHLKLVAEPNEVFAVVFLNSAPSARLRADVQGHGRSNLGVPAGAGAARPGPQRLGGHPGPPASIGHDRAFGRRSALTDRLKAALAMVDVRVVDHFIVGKGTPYSFAESGLL
jgi:DNA repair protein RadC